MHRTGDDAAQNAGDEELGHALHADQQDDEHEGVGRALDGHEVLDIVAIVEGQHDVAHEEQSVQGRGTHGAEDVAPRTGLIELFQAAEDQADTQAHQHAHSHAEDEGVDGADLKQRTGHGRSAGDGVIEAHRAEHAAQNGTRCRAHGDRAHGDGKGQKAHVKRAHGHTAQTDGLHDQLDGDQQCQPGESTKIVVFHNSVFPPAAVPPLASDTAQTCPLCAGFVVDILIVLLERVVSGRVPKRECRYRSPGKRMPADRRATVSTRLTAMEVSCMRVHSSWSPLSIARANVSNSAASRGRPPFRL